MSLKYVLFLFVCLCYCFIASSQTETTSKDLETNFDRRVYTTNSFGTAEAPKIDGIIDEAETFLVFEGGMITKEWMKGTGWFIR